MSILIKSMEMPTDCLSCDYKAFDVQAGTTYCRRTKTVLARDYNVIGDGYKPNDCPIIFIPPHGRLIDADAMRASIPPCFTMEEICKAFKDAPTIIPASEEGE